MNRLNRAQLIAEAKAQNKALKTIKKWLAYAIGSSTIGAALICFAFTGATAHVLIGVLGVILTFVSLIAAFLINLGIRRGTRNVEKLICAAESK